MLIFLFVLILSPVVMAQGDQEQESVPKDWLDQATFSNNKTELQYERYQNIGLAIPDFLAWGLTYKKPLSQQRTAWVLVTYQPSKEIYFEPSEGSEGTFPLATGWTEKSRSQLMLGIDQILHPTLSKRWGVLLGVGVGLNQSKYQYQYSATCVIFCPPTEGDPNLLNRTEDDIFGFIGGRIGLIWMDQKIWGTTGHVAAAITPRLLRTGKDFVFKDAKGNELQTESNMSFILEMTIDI